MACNFAHSPIAEEVCWRWNWLGLEKPADDGPTGGRKEDLICTAFGARSEGEGKVSGPFSLDKLLACLLQSDTWQDRIDWLWAGMFITFLTARTAACTHFSERSGLRRLRADSWPNVGACAGDAAAGL
jgi:hypothetical protein